MRILSLLLSLVLAAPALAQPAYQPGPGPVPAGASTVTATGGTTARTLTDWFQGIDKSGTTTNFTGPLQVSNPAINLGTNSTAPMITINGQTNSTRGIQWQAQGTPRWKLQTDSSDNLNLYGYDASGAFIGTPLTFSGSATMNSTWPLTISTSLAPTTTGTSVGSTVSAHNTGIQASIGSLFQYFSNAGATGFDTGAEFTSVFTPTYQTGINPALEGMFVVTITPNDSHGWGSNNAEWNIVNRGPDDGWHRDRLGANPTGNILFVPEVSNFGQGGEGKNATYAVSVSHSGGNNSTGFPAKYYSDFMCEPNSEVGLTGRCIYATGDITATSSQIPYSPFQTDGTWAHGFSTSRATYSDGYAVRLGVGQGIAWDVGGIDAPTATASITTSGSGANQSIAINPAGTGLVNVAGPLTATGDVNASSGNLYVGTSTGTSAQAIMNGPATIARQFSFQTGGLTRWQIAVTGAEGGANAGGDISWYRYADNGGFLGTALSISRATGNVTAGANLNAASYSSGGTAGVSCAAGTVSLATLVVTSGIITHC